MLAVSSELIVFAGKSGIYCRSLTTGFGNGQHSGSSVHPDITFPAEWISKKCNVECIATTPDGKLIAVADSSHGINIFERDSNGEWISAFAGVSDKRLIKLQFAKSEHSHFLTFMDKQGDIFVLPISENEPRFLKIKKIMGHTSFISDYVIRLEHKQIISCDRDEKIRVSNFPDSFVIQGFKLGHTEAVINMSFLKKSGNLLSISVFGNLILWDFNTDVNGTSTDCLKNWNVKDVLSLEKMEEVTSMKAVEDGDDIVISVTFGGSSKIAILKILRKSLSLEFMQYVDVGSDQIIMEWTSKNVNDAYLVVFTPLNGTLGYWKLLDGISKDLSINFPAAMKEDIKALGQIHKPSVVPMKKRQTPFEGQVTSAPSEKVKA